MKGYYKYMVRNKKTRLGKKHKLRNTVKEKEKIFDNRMKKFDEKIHGEKLWVKRLQILKDNLSGKEYNELVNQLKIILTHYITDFNLLIDDYIHILHEPTGNKIFNLLETDMNFINYLKLKLESER